LRTPAKARLRVTQAAWAVFHAEMRLGGAGASEEANRWMPEPEFSGVQAEAGLGVGVVGDLGAAVGVDGGVGFAGGDDLDTARGEQRAKADAEGQREGLFGWWRVCRRGRRRRERRSERLRIVERRIFAGI
jgi:hypothetical protein